VSAEAPPRSLLSSRLVVVLLARDGSGGSSVSLSRRTLAVTSGGSTAKFRWLHCVGARRQYGRGGHRRNIFACGGGLGASSTATSVVTVSGGVYGTAVAGTTLNLLPGSAGGSEGDGAAPVAYSASGVGTPATSGAGGVAIFSVPSTANGRSAGSGVNGGAGAAAVVEGGGGRANATGVISGGHAIIRVIS